uniref:Uncharacterized protein n=1 Tax=Manihot esculenta TaxID=3983 RepID=A0A2C9V0P1_MANES
MSRLVCCFVFSFLRWLPGYIRLRMSRLVCYPRILMGEIYNDTDKSYFSDFS